MAEEEHESGSRCGKILGRARAVREPLAGQTLAGGVAVWFWRPVRTFGPRGLRKGVPEGWTFRGHYGLKKPRTGHAMWGLDL